jgi:hypothetical protein
MIKIIEWPLACKNYIRKIRRLAQMYSRFFPLKFIAKKQAISEQDLEMFAVESNDAHL